MAINVNASRSTINQQLLGKLSVSQPGGVKSKGGLSGLVSKKEAQQTQSKKLLSSLAIRENRTVRDMVGVGERGSVTGLDRSSRSVKAALKNANRGVTAATEADSALAEIEGFLEELKGLAETAALSSALPGERTELNQQFTDLLSKLDDKSSSVQLNGVPLLDGTAGQEGSSEEVVIATSSSATALVAQTSPLAAGEVLTFKDFGIFEGMAGGDRQVSFASGDTQADVINKINNDATVGALVQASADVDGKLVITAVATGPTQFKFDSNKNEDFNSTGIGKSDIVADLGTSDTTAASSVTALVAQTGALAQDETLRFKDFGIFEHLDGGDREIDLDKFDTQTDVINKINSDSIIGALVTASSNADGKLVISSNQVGQQYVFEVDSDRNESATSTGIGKSDLLGNNGTNATAQAAFVVAEEIQTDPLDNDETITFDNFGLFAGLSTNDRRIELDENDTQAEVISKINSDPIVGALVQASTDPIGRLKITSLQAGTAYEFRVKSSEGANDDTTGLDDNYMDGDNGVDIVTDTIETPGFGGLDNLQVDVGVDAGDRYTLEFDTITAESLDLDDKSLATEADANTAVTAIDDAINTVKKARIRAQSDLSKLSSTADRLTNRLDTLSSTRSSITDAEDASGAARALTQRDATTALVTQANIRPDVGLRLLG